MTPHSGHELRVVDQDAEGALLRERFPLDVSVREDIAVPKLHDFPRQADDALDDARPILSRATKRHDLPPLWSSEQVGRLVDQHAITGQLRWTRFGSVDMPTDRTNHAVARGGIGFADQRIAAIVAMNQKVMSQQGFGHRTASHLAWHREALQDPGPHHDEKDHEPDTSLDEPSGSNFWQRWGAW